MFDGLMMLAHVYKFLRAELLFGSRFTPSSVLVRAQMTFIG
jgi:hypothetical protein